MAFGAAGFFVSAVYIAVFVVVVWLVLAALNRIGRGVEEIAQALRRIEAKDSRETK